MSDNGTGRGCLKSALFGCLGLAVLFVGSIVFLVVMQALFERGSEDSQVTRSAQHSLPSVSDFDALVASGEVGEAGEQLSLTGQTTADLAASAPTTRVELVLDFGEFKIVPGEPGRGVEIDARYDERVFKVSEQLVESDNGDSVLRIRSVPRGGGLGMVMRGAGRGPKSFITIKLPPDVPLEIDADLGLGEGHLELGGLLLRSVAVDFATGNHSVSFSQPTLVPLERLRVEKGIGTLLISQLGNASPKTMEMEQSVGDATVDLTGAWVRDADVELRTGIGEINIAPPDTARLQAQTTIAVGDGNMPKSQDALPPDAPVVRLRASGGVGVIDPIER